MKHLRRIWLLFGLAVVALVAAMVWVTVLGVRLEDSHAQAQRQAALEERVRLALWRMDSSLSGILARENSRPYFTYNPFYPENRAYTRMFSPLEPGEVLVPSRLLTFDSPYIRLYFQVSPDGTVTSPEVPTGNMRDLAESSYLSAKDIERAGRRLSDLSSSMDRKAVVQATRPPKGDEEPRTRLAEDEQEYGSPPVAQQQRQMNMAALRARGRQVAQSMMQNAPRKMRLKGADDVKEGPLKAIWATGHLMLVRRVEANGDLYLQGCWMDWDAMREWLLGEVQDLLPNARLLPVRSSEEPEDYRLLASLPARLIPGEVALPEAGSLYPVRLSLVVAWGCLLLAVVAVGFLLRGLVSLSERRADFVSAVTHELRTPLTTFQLYCDMLADGMIRDEDRKRHYLETLRSQSYRLGHLVENVLLFARLEQRGAREKAELLTVKDLMERARQRIQEHAERCGLSLCYDAEERASRLKVSVDASAVEQILFNLVDNACKYASNSDEGPVEVRARRDGSEAVLAVRDHGPGIPKAEARQIFRPFHKSAEDAANSSPGVGLGLALSRRLARSMGGELRLKQTGGNGACFELRLPIVGTPEGR